MKISPRLYGLMFAAASALGISPVQAQVAPVPSFSTLIAGDYSSPTYAFVDVAGYYSSGDSGGGGAYQGNSTCATTTTAATIASGSPTITVATTTGIITGMSLYAEVSASNPIPPGDAVTAVNGNIITLAQPTTNSETSTTTMVLGGNGGTIFMDYQPTTASPACFYRQNYTGDVRQFGAKCDVVYSASDGSTNNGNQFTASLVTFTQADKGKVFELNYARGVSPFRTTIAQVGNGSGTSNTVHLNSDVPAAFPNDSKAADANMNFPPNGQDTAGFGWQPGQIGVAAGGSPNTPAQIQIKQTGLVNFTVSNSGSGYRVNDILYGSGTGVGVNQSEPAQLQVVTVNGGAIQTYAIVYSGLWKGANPTTIVWSGGHGSGFATNLLSNNASFGVATVTLYGGGDYQKNGVPPNPVTLLTETQEGTGWTADLTFSTSDWSYGTDDTVALQNIENYAETYPALPLQNTVQYSPSAGLPGMRGLAGAVRVPSGMCYASGVLVSRPVSWSGAGPRQSRLIQLLGSAGISVNGSPAGFFTLPIAYPPGDDYEQSGYGQPQPSFENLAFWGSSPQTIADIDGTNYTSSGSGIVLANPAANQGKAVPFYLSNVEIQRFPQYDLSAQHWGGVIRGYHVNLFHAGGTQSDSFQNWSAGQTVFNLPTGFTTTGLFAGMSVYPGDATVLGIPLGEVIAQVNSLTQITLTLPTTASGSGTLNFVSGDCLDMERIANPSHFYGLVTAFCDKGINIVRGAQYEFNGWVGYSNNINVSVAGTGGAEGNTITFYGAEFTETRLEELYLDQQNESFICFMCKFKKGNQGGATSGPYDSDIVIGPDAGSGAAGSLYPVLQLSAPVFGVSDADNTLFFAQDPASLTYCTCRVTLDGLAVDHRDMGGGVPTIYPQSLASQVFSGNLYAPLQFATGTGTAVATAAPANGNFGTATFGQPSRLYSYLTANGNKTFNATPPGGTGNWNVSFAYDVWDIERSGITAPVTDTWDTASDIIAVINNGGSYAAAGQRYSVVVCNSGNATEMFAAGTGDTLAGITSLAAGTCGRFALLITATGSSPAITIVGA